MTSRPGRGLPALDDDQKRERGDGRTIDSVHWERENREEAYLEWFLTANENGSNGSVRERLTSLPVPKTCHAWEDKCFPVDMRQGASVV